MMPSPQGEPLSARLGARLGPEVVGSILVVAVLFVAVAVALTGQRGSAAPASASPSLVAVLPSASTVPSSTPASAPPIATATPLVTPSPPTSTLPSEQAAAARAVLEDVDELLDERAGLETEVARKITDSQAIADLLRQVNASIVRQDGPLADLAAYSSTADLARRIRAVNSATFDTVNRIQHTSPRNARTYRDGAAEVVDKLKSLPALRAELAALTG